MASRFATALALTGMVGCKTVRLETSGANIETLFDKPASVQVIYEMPSALAYRNLTNVTGMLRLVDSSDDKNCYQFRLASGPTYKQCDVIEEPTLLK